MFVLIFISFVGFCTASPLDTKANLQIVGGTAYNIATVPYQAGLEYGIYSTKSLICGASIISNYYLLTAAHCRVSTTLSYYRVRVGTNTTGSGGTLYYLSEFVRHSNYNPSTYANDIAYMKTKTAIVFNTRVKPAKMIAAWTTLNTSQKLLVTGWGTTKSGGSISYKLLGAVIDYVPESICKSRYGSTMILPGMICAAAPGKDSCQGDSGGPLVINNATKTLVGIVSWGYGCADPKYPGVYTRLASYRVWLKNNIGF